jgi:flagella basal body P-ring formation protein FlgA
MARSLQLLPMLLLAAGAAVAAAGDSATGAIETRLHSQRPEVIRWEIAEIAGSARRVAPGGDVQLVGTVGPRTAVRFGDGRVRWYSVEGFGRVMTSVHALAAGAEVAATDLALSERDVIALGCEPLVELGDLRRWRATRRVAAGEPLCTHSIEPAPEVQRGHEVTVRAELGVIQVSRVLVANNDAWTGERVRLRDPASGETLQAVVTGAGAARGLTSGENR